MADPLESLERMVDEDRELDDDDGRAPGSGECDFDIFSQ